MIRREPDRPARPLRELSARLLEDQLVRLARANGVIERRLGPGLRSMSGERLYRRLGFVRLGDYLTERLGMSLRRCQTIIRCDRALRQLPAVAAAFDAGELPPSKLRAIVGVATEETEEFWLARARRVSVSELAAAARVARQENNRATEAADVGQGSGNQPTAPENQEPAQETAEDERLEVSFRAPARVVALWHWALDLVRRAAGHQEPAWRCVEYLAAEFLSGVPLAAASATAGDLPARGSEAGREPPSGNAEDTGHGKPGQSCTGDPADASFGAVDGSVPGALTWNAATAASRDAFRPLGRAADPDLILTGQSLTGKAGRGASDASPPDPWNLDNSLRGLIRLRQSLAWRQGRLLAVLASHRLHEELGAESLGEWCEVTLGMSSRRARYLISLDRRIMRLPQIGDAYRRGLISWCQARQLVRIAAPETEQRWIRYARQVTVRRLEESIAQAESATTSSQLIGAVPIAEPRMPESNKLEENSANSIQDGADDRLTDARRHMCAPSLPFEESSSGGVSERLARRIRFWLPGDVAGLWRQALTACRQSTGRHMDDWQCLIMMIDSLRKSWESPADRGWQRRYRIFERDGWQCRVPGCTSRANLNEHHIVFRSRGGGNQDENLVTLCVGHHQRGIHDGLIRCIGTAPDEIYWELGVRSSGPPLLRCRGDRIIKGSRMPGRVGRAKVAHRPA